ncbi:MAG: CPBP family intramembrane glutamic endopeptidase [Rhizomicrobium sp.]|jgi:membrane protease YdiL (CAAX protease family)
MLSAYTPLDFLVVAAAVSMVVYGVVSGIRTARIPRSELNLVRRYWFTIARALLISATVLLDWHWAGRSWAALGFDFPIGFRGRVGFGIDAAIVCFYAYVVLLRKFTPQRIAVARRHQDSLRILPQTRAEMALFPVMALVASPFEELLFRGFLMWFFLPLAGLWGGAVLSSLLFGSSHAYQGWRGILRTGAIGFAFAAAYALTHSLWWLMLGHTVLNIGGGVLARKINRLTPAPAEVA